ncbi:MAG TPA: hypothetical protein PK366_06370, partial [Fibrobacteraceae bacterium]|nr:hypothetical protein [Fibrobacteraceae bacterium]
MSKETDPQHQSSKNKNWSRRLIAVAFFAIFVSSVVFTAWTLFYWLDHFLKEKQTYGSVVVEPFQYSRDHILSHHWDSILVYSPDFSISIQKPRFRIFDLLSSKRSALLKVEHVKCHFSTQPKDSTSAPFSLDSIKIPNIKIPIPVFIELDSSLVEVDSTLFWKTQGLKINNESANNVILSIDTIDGSYLASSLNINAMISLDDIEVASEIKINSINGKDQVKLKANAPKDELRSYKIELEAIVQDPKQWLPENTLPTGIPTLSDLKFKIDFSENEDHSNYIYNGNIQINTSEFWPLEALRNDISFSGDSKEIIAEAFLRNEDGGEIELHGTLDFDLNFNLRGSVKDMSAEFGPQIMPLDVQIHSAVKKGNSIVADIKTRRGSEVKANLSNLDSNLRIDYQARITPTESWALDWTSGNVILEDITH